MENVGDLEESSFAFKIDDYYQRETSILTELIVDAGATSCIIRDSKKF